MSGFLGVNLTRKGEKEMPWYTGFEVSAGGKGGKLRAATKDGKGGGLKGGFTPSVHVRTAKSPCQLAEIKWKKGKSTGGVKTEGVPFTEAGDSAEVVFHPKMPFCLTSYKTCKALGRIAAMDSN